MKQNQKLINKLSPLIGAHYLVAPKPEPKEIELRPDEVFEINMSYPMYEVSNYGTVRRIYDTKGRRLAKPVYLRLHDDDGFPSVRVIRGTLSLKYYEVRINTMVALTFISARPNGRFVAANKDGNTLNNHISNIQWMHLRNYAKRRKKGKTYPGSSHRCAKLTEEQVLQIRHLFQKGLSAAKIWESFSWVNRTTIENIVRNRSWKHIDLVPKHFTENHRNANRKLSKEQVFAILELRDGKKRWAIKEIAEMFGVGKSTIQQIFHKAQYKDFIKDYELQKRSA